MAAYGSLVRLHQEAAFRVACLISGDPSDAEDAAQEAFIKAYRALDRFRPGAPFRPWLLAIVSNEARNRRRETGRRASLVLRAAGAPSAETPSPESSVVAAERRDELLVAVERLGEEARAVISCRYFLGLSEEETAAALNCPKGTVKSRLSRALARLRESMVKERDAG